MRKFAFVVLVLATLAVLRGVLVEHAGPILAVFAAVFLVLLGELSLRRSDLSIGRPPSRHPARREVEAGRSEGLN